MCPRTGPQRLSLIHKAYFKQLYAVQYHSTMVPQNVQQAAKFARDLMNAVSQRDRIR